MTVRIELTLDMDSYNKKYGPGSEYAKKYGPQQWQANPNWLEEIIMDVLHEGFHDWDREGWMKVETAPFSLTLKLILALRASFSFAFSDLRAAAVVRSERWPRFAAFARTGAAPE